ncbi:hypothetical protein MYU51_001535 [Penicillium brevicompactum]|uniref:uncharacterized protein n=1 Tax=Penicillium brevicompactum TaxID=5074 RepID=UPI0025416A31|nr:uncharacterized protein N7506_009967 [Penicillium brevicompactum]KAJ5326865.1 hypothetical protein N7506_009967 [Penicillium brevicompactum]
MASEHETPGKRTIATVLDKLAREHPTRLVCKAPKGPRVANGFSSLDIGTLSKAVDSTAWLITESFGTPEKDEVLLYLGDSDIRYLVFVVACQKAGFKPFLPSTKNSIDVQCALLETTGCSGVLFSSTLKLQVEEIKAFKASVAVMEVPKFEQMVTNFSRYYPYDTAYQAIEDETAIIIHSSGTTGVPKPIHLTHGFLGTVDKQGQIAVPKGRVSAIPKKTRQNYLFLSTAPFFHLMGIYATAMSVFQGAPFVYPPPTASLTIETFIEVISAEHPTVAVITPALVEAVGQSATALEALSALEMVCIGGAPLAPDIGDTINKRTNLVSVLGASELGLIPSLIPENKADWEYFEWNPNYQLRMDPSGDDSQLHELVIPRGESRDIHGIFHTFPDLTEYRTKDLFSPHPTRPSLWRYEGRLDDTITLISGQKISPIPMEKIIEGHPLVSRAVVIGNRRSQLALLVEPCESSNLSSRNESDISEYKRTIWPAVEKVNELAPHEVQIGIMRIGLASRGKPFCTTPKGSTQRRKVLQDYEREIEHVYQQDEYWTTLFKNG